RPGPSGTGAIGRLTLLPGPDLLSPARTTPTLMPSPIKLKDAAPEPAIPAVPPFLSGGRSPLRLIPSPPDRPLSLSYRPTEARPRTTVPPPPEVLRFEATLEPPPSSLKEKPAQKTK